MLLSVPRRSAQGAPRRRVAANALLIVTSVALLATGLITPAIARAPVAPVATLPFRSDTGRLVGTGVHVDARRAARAATTPRVRTPLARRSPYLRVRSASKPMPGSRSHLATPRKGLASGLGVKPRIVSQPPPLVTTKFDGLSEGEACSCEPPDPWIAASPSFVVQTTNGMVRVYNRAGATLISSPTWASFAVPLDRSDSDPRILWDAVHSRWVGVLVTYNSDFTDTGLRLAVSETADPTAGWIVYPIETGAELPDFPGISTSADKIVLTSNDFDPSSNYLGASFFVMDWANVLAGTSLYVGPHHSAPDLTIGNLRPAIMLSSAPNIPVIFERSDTPTTFHPEYFEITGNAHTAMAATLPVNLTLPLSGSPGIAPFTLPPAPVQPGAAEITNAVDERPTDAVFRNGQLWFVATGDFFDGSNDWAKARYSVVATSANGTAPTSAADVFGEGSGTHFFMPGVGINADGSAILAATMTDPTSTYPTTVVGGIMAGSGLTPYVSIESSTTAYLGTRWGDYLGIAADPSGAGAVWLAHELVADDGSWRTSVVRMVSDGTAPGTPGVVSQSLVVPSTLGVTVPIRTLWGAAVDADSGVAQYLVERSDDGSGFFGTAIRSLAVTQPLLLGLSSQYRISAIDAVGNVGAPRYGPAYTPRLFQSTSSTVYSGTWHTSTSTSYSGGSTRYSSSAGASATFTVSGARSIAFVTTKASTRGSFRVYVDGVHKATISTFATSTRLRQLLYQFSWTSAGTHKIKIVVVGTAHHPRVDVDAFVVLRFP